MRETAKRLLYDAFQATGATALFGRLNHLRVPILFYHGVTDKRTSGVVNCEDNHLYIEDFEAHLRYLKERCHVVSLRDYSNSLRQRTPLKPGSVVLTFDDGFENNYTVAFPLLKKYGMPATIYATADFVAQGKPLWVDRLACAYAAVPTFTDELRISSYLSVKSALKKLPGAERLAQLEKVIGELTNGAEPKLDPLFAPLKKEQLREMIASGLVEIGSHSLSHPLLTTLSVKDQRREIEESKSLLSELCGVEIQSFAYPNGDYDSETRDLVEAAGYANAVGVGLRLSGPEENIFALSRVALGAGESDAVIAATLSGLRQWIIALRQSH
jgi:peptidoglycan/xylan/chitin deacetylase (PgdA/CDA1 family)